MDNKKKARNNTWRYIDDLEGIGQRNWKGIDYGMEHTDTTEESGKACTFLGMRIEVANTEGEGGEGETCRLCIK